MELLCDAAWTGRLDEVKRLLKRLLKQDCALLNAKLSTKCMVFLAEPSLLLKHSTTVVTFRCLGIISPVCAAIGPR